MKMHVDGVLYSTFTGLDAAVACRQLGLPLPARVLPNGQYGTGSGRMWINSVDCLGDERRLEVCAHGLYGNAPIRRGNATFKCTHEDAVAIECGFNPPASKPCNVY